MQQGPSLILGVALVWPVCALVTYRMNKRVHHLQTRRIGELIDTHAAGLADPEPPTMKEVVERLHRRKERHEAARSPEKVEMGVRQPRAPSL